MRRKLKALAAGPVEDPVAPDEPKDDAKNEPEQPEEDIKS